MENLTNQMATQLDKNYLLLAKSFIEKATELDARNNESFMIRNAFEELVVEFRKCEQADCEYSSYAACHSAEIWLQFILDRI